MFIYTCGTVSDKGDVRAENQDSILALQKRIEKKNAALFVVADGMGGLSYGAQTSRCITDQFERWWVEEFPGIVQENMDREEDIREFLEQEIWDINQMILAFNSRMRSKSGSTLSLLLLYKDCYYIENIGDSRIYLLRDKVLYQLTEDQSLVAHLVRQNRMSEEEAQHSAMKNKLTMCIGMFPVPKSNYYTGKILKGDCFLLCSDGFYQSLQKAQLEKVLRECEFDAREKVEYLRHLIEPGKAKDNVSAIVAEVGGGK